MQTCSFCGRRARRMLKVGSLSLCESCEASLLRVSAGCAAYDWFVRAARLSRNVENKGHTAFEIYKCLTRANAKKGI